MSVLGSFLLLSLSFTICSSYIVTKTVNISRKELKIEMGFGDILKKGTKNIAITCQINSVLV